jgi:hypothetical protein
MAGSDQKWQEGGVVALTEERPHSAIGNNAPITLTKSGGTTSLSPCQPVTLIEAGKLSPKAVEGSGSDQFYKCTPSKMGGLAGQVNTKPRHAQIYM